MSQKKRETLVGCHRFTFSTVTTPRKPVKAKNAKRAKREKLRAYGPQAFLNWLHEQPCVAHTAACVIFQSNNPIHAAHIKTGGMGRKADANQLVPLCEWHHRHLHAMGRASFEAFYNVNLQYEAARTQREYAVATGQNQEEA